MGGSGAADRDGLLSSSRVGSGRASAARPSKVQVSLPCALPRLGPRAVLDAPGAPRRGRIGKAGGDRFCAPNRSAERRLAQPDNMGKAYLQAVSALGWGSGRFLETSLSRSDGEVAARRADGGADAVRRRAALRPLHHSLRERSPSPWLRYREDPCPLPVVCRHSARGRRRTRRRVPASSGGGGAGCAVASGRGGGQGRLPRTKDIA